MFTKNKDLMSVFHGHNNYLVTVNSADRLSGTETNFVINLKMKKGDWDRVALHQLSLPRAYFDVDSYTSTFTLVELGVSIPLSLPIGNYNVLVMATTLASVLTAGSQNSWVYTCTYPAYGTPNISKFTFGVTGTGVGANPPSLVFTPQDLWIQAGFNANSTNTFTMKSATTATLVSTNVLVISYINRVYLQSNICSESKNNLLQPILIAGNYASNSFIYWENLLPDVNSQKFTNSLDNVFNFTFFDQYSNVILNNGVDCNFTLLFYKKDDTSSMQFEHLQIQNLERLGSTIRPDE